MSALNLLRAYRYPQVAARADGDLTPERFLDGRANTIYVVAAGHDQEALRPVILALLAAIYEAAIVKARTSGALDPRLFMLMDEAANIAPVRNLAAVALAVRRPRDRDRDDLAVDRADRPALRARRARRDLRGVDRAGVHPAVGRADERGIPHGTARRGARRQRLRVNRPARHTLSIGHQKAAPVTVAAADRPRTRDPRSTGDLPPAIVRAPGWFEDPRFARYAQLLAAHS